MCCVKRWLESVSQLTYYYLYKIIPKLFREHQIFINLHENIFLYKYTYNMHLYHTDPILYFTNANMTVFKVWSFENKTLKSQWPRENLFSNKMIDWIQKQIDGPWKCFLVVKLLKIRWFGCKMSICKKSIMQNAYTAFYLTINYLS